MSRFGKGSRYRRVGESPVWTARGEWVLGKNLRVMPRVAGRFRHTVRVGDRLDLLAGRYYGDPTRWWRIADANPATPWPPDLLDRGFLVDHDLELDHPGYRERLERVRVALAAIAASLGPVDLLGAVLTCRVTGTPERAQVTAAVATAKLEVLDARAWTDDRSVARESFALHDPLVTLHWNEMVRALAALPGVTRVIADAAAGRIVAAVDSRAVTSQEIRFACKVGERFDVTGHETRSRSRPGATVLIPPDAPV